VGESDPAFVDVFETSVLAKDALADSIRPGMTCAEAEQAIAVEGALRKSRKTPVENPPPRIVFTERDSALVLVHGEPAWFALPGTSLQRAVNTRPFLARSADGRLTITYNGEIYNYRALRAELEAKGCVFRSDSDTEVLLHLYADRGAAMVHALRGMFAFGLWDARRQELFLARDPFGIKPLYYADDGRTFRFASQVKALRAGGAIGEAPEPAGSVGFLLLGSVPEPYTLYRDIRALPAGAT